MRLKIKYQCKVCPDSNTFTKGLFCLLMGQLQGQVHFIKSNKDPQFWQANSQQPVTDSWQNTLIPCWNSDSARDIHNKVVPKQLENHRMPEVRRCLRRSSRTSSRLLIAQDHVQTAFKYMNYRHDKIQ